MTSPFMLATKKKNPVVPDQETQQTPIQSGMYGMRTEPAEIDPRRKWEVKRDDLITTDQNQQNAAVIAPVAASIPTSTYTDRFAPIRSIGEIAAVGQANSSEVQRQQAAQRAANQLAQMQSDALGNAYAASANVDMNGMPVDQGAGAGWGSGGAQGVANVLRAAGFSEDLIPTFMAIAKAESGWNPSALNTSNRNGSTDAGLFQINSVHRGNSWYPTNLNDPLQSAKAALAIYKQQGLKAWTVYNTGAYKQFLSSTVPPKQVTAIPSVSGGVQSTGNGSLRNAVVQKSLVVLNLPYVWGGTSLKTGVDCSGLTQAVYQQVLGRNIPRQARAQAVNGAVGTQVGSYNQLKPGDLVAFKWAGGYAGPNAVSHIAIYAGNGEIIESYGGNNGRRRKLGNSAQDRGAIYLSVKFPGE